MSNVAFALCVTMGQQVRLLTAHVESLPLAGARYQIAGRRSMKESVFMLPILWPEHKVNV